MSAWFLYDRLISKGSDGMKSQPNDRLKGAAKTNAAAILLIPKQNFLTLQVDDYSAKFDRSLHTGIMKLLSQKMLLAYEKEDVTW